MLAFKSFISLPKCDIFSQTLEDFVLNLLLFLNNLIFFDNNLMLFLNNLMLLCISLMILIRIWCFVNILMFFKNSFSTLSQSLNYPTAYHTSSAMAVSSLSEYGGKNVFLSKSHFANAFLSENERRCGRFPGINLKNVIFSQK